MAEGKTMRLSQVARKLNVGTTSIIAHLADKGVEVENKPNAKITLSQFNLLAEEFAGAAVDKEEAADIAIGESYIAPSVLPSETAKPSTGEEKKMGRHETVVPQLPG
ncbi:MAG: translation initiation factor IF-2 N-terminal domain-containing protein, partial [Bacteroidota bacterium]